MRFGATNLAVGRHVESLAEDIFLHFGTTVLVERVRLGSTLAEQLVFGPDSHRNVQECLVQEGNAGFETPSHCRSFHGNGSKDVRMRAIFFLYRVAGWSRTCWLGDNLPYADPSLCERIPDGMNVHLEQRENRDNLRRIELQVVPSPGAELGRITSKYLVATLATQDHLDAHSLDLATQ